MFEWKDAYSVRIDQIDGQHKKLFRLAAQLHQATAAGNSKAVLAELFHDLIEYTKVHFAHEEQLMMRAGYPDLIPHQAEHAALLKKVHDFHKQYEGGTAPLSIDLLNFLQDWLEKHILHTDQAYAPYLKAKSVA